MKKGIEDVNKVNFYIKCFIEFVDILFLKYVISFYYNNEVVVNFRRLSNPFCIYAILVDELLSFTLFEKKCQIMQMGIATSLQRLLKVGRGIYDTFEVLKYV